MNIKIILYVMDRKMTRLLRAMDLFEDCKFFCKPYEITFNTTSPISDDYFMKLITSSNESESPIGALIFNNTVYKNPEIPYVSDGTNWF